MQVKSFVRVPYPARSVVQVAPSPAASYHIELVEGLLRCGLPAARRRGRLRSMVARRGLPRSTLTALYAALPRRAEPELDSLRDQLSGRWSDLSDRSPRLPQGAPDLSFLRLQRRDGTLVFAFGEQSHPLLVCKIPNGLTHRLDDEAAFLDSNDTLPVAPRYLGRVGEARIQEGMPGRTFGVKPLARDAAVAAEWSVELSDAAEVAAAIASLTRGTSGHLLTTMTPAAEALVAPTTVRRVKQALHRLGRLAEPVTCHGDFSPQNVLVENCKVSAVVDWELQRSGLPGADLLNLVQSVFEQRMGLLRWKEDEVYAAFAEAWDQAPLFVIGRRRAADLADKSGLAQTLSADLEVAFFARRLQRRVDQPHGYVVGPALAARMLEHACVS